MATILIVDDLSVNRMVLVLLLRAQGHRLLEAADGGAGLAAAQAEHPDLVITDVLMPVMDGYELVKQLQLDPATRSIPVVFYTAHYGEREARALARSSGVSYVLTKPVEPDEVLRVVAQVLGGRSETADPQQSAALTPTFDREHLRLLTDKLSEKTGNLRTANARLRALINIGLELAGERDANRLLQSLGASACDLLGATYVTVGVLDQDQLVQSVVTVGAGSVGWIAAGDPVPGILNTVISERRTIRGENRGGQPAALGLPPSHPTIHAYLAAPVASPAHVYSWICLVGNEGRSFTGEDEDLLIALAGQVGRIYENVHLSAIMRKRTEDLVLLTERLSLATSLAGVGVWEWDLASNAMTWDATMCRIYGVPAGVVPSETDRAAAVHPADRSIIEATLQRVIAEKRRSAEAVEFRIILPSGSVRTVSAVEGVVLDDAMNVTRLVGVNMDVTERKEAEAAKERSRDEQMRFKDEFLSHVSHELRSPLTAVKQFTTILLGGLAGDLNTQQHEYQQIVLKNVCQLQSMIGDILEVTRLETGKLTVELESVSVPTVVADTIDSFQITARAKGVTIASQLPPDLPSVHADHTRLRQILIILVENAIKFTPEGGAVLIEAHCWPSDPRFLLFEVSDTGSGVRPEDRARIFERLYQSPESIQDSSRKGLGLGLYISKELVTRQGGRIWVEPRPQRGSIFSFTLPVASLDNVIAPLFKNGRWPADSLALVMVEGSLPDGWPSPASREEWSHEARSVVQHCLAPDLDALLPAVRADAVRERVFAATFTDSAGASLLATRIRKQSQRSPSLRLPGLTVSVSQSMLAAVPGEADAVADRMVSDMAGTIEQAIDRAISAEAVIR